MKLEGDYKATEPSNLVNAAANKMKVGTMTEGKPRSKKGNGSKANQEVGTHNVQVTRYRGDSNIYHGYS